MTCELWSPRGPESTMRKCAASAIAPQADSVSVRWPTTPVGIMTGSMVRELWALRAQPISPSGLGMRCGAHSRDAARRLSFAADLGACTAVPLRRVTAGRSTPAPRTLAVGRRDRAPLLGMRRASAAVVSPARSAPRPLTWSEAPNGDPQSRRNRAWSRAGRVTPRPGVV